MPMRPCLEPRCPTLVPVTSGTRGRCPAHAREHERFRGSRIERGYDNAWLKLRAWFIRQPENVLCRMCSAKGKTRCTDEVDHIVPFEGLHDPLRLAVSNLQGLCVECHRAKTSRQLMRASDGK